MIVNKHILQAALVIISMMFLACGDPVSVPDGIIITQPASDDLWYSWQEDYQIIWNEATATGVIRIELWKNSEKTADISGWIDNTGSYTFTDVLPSDWGEGSGYTIKIRDNEDHEGSSGSFSLEDDIPVLTPVSTTRWFSVFPDYEITWTETSAANVKIELWRNEDIIADICSWVSNDGEYTHQTILDHPGGAGYRVRVIDENGFDGYSDYFDFAQIVAYWSCDGDLQDASGNGHNGIVYNGSAVADRNGNPNSALRFNGNTNSYGEVDDFYAWQDGITIIAWVKYHEPRTSWYSCVVRKYKEFRFGHSWSGVWGNCFSASINTSGTNFNWDSFQYDEWYCLAITYDISTLVFYINGNTVQTYSTSEDITDFNSTFTIAHGPNDETSNITADEIIILSEAVDESVIQYLYGLY